jgi:hypothetical protein
MPRPYTQGEVGARSAREGLEWTDGRAGWATREPRSPRDDTFPERRTQLEPPVFEKVSDRDLVTLADVLCRSLEYCSMLVASRVIREVGARSIGMPSSTDDHIRSAYPHRTQTTRLLTGLLPSRSTTSRTSISPSSRSRSATTQLATRADGTDTSRSDVVEAPFPSQSSQALRPHSPPVADLRSST